MGVSLTVILADNWMKTFEEKHITEVEMGLGETNNSKQKWPTCHKVVWNNKSVECET